MLKKNFSEINSGVIARVILQKRIKIVDLTDNDVLDDRQLFCVVDFFFHAFRSQQSVSVCNLSSLSTVARLLNVSTDRTINDVIISRDDTTQPYHRLMNGTSSPLARSKIVTFKNWKNGYSNVIWFQWNRVLNFVDDSIEIIINFSGDLCCKCYSRYRDNDIPQIIKWFTNLSVVPVKTDNRFESIFLSARFICNKQIVQHTVRRTVFTCYTSPEIRVRHEEYS